MLHKLSLVIFRRDLRLDDQLAIGAAALSSEKILPCFIFDDRQITKKNPYRSMYGQQFLIESLKDLQDDVKSRGGKLFFFSGIAEEVIEKLLKELPIDAVYMNRDYTPFSRKRDRAIGDVCKKHQKTFVLCNDALLNEPEDIHKDDGKPYTVFTPFWRRASEHKIRSPEALSGCHFYTKSIKEEWKEKLDSLLPDLPGKPAVNGGRTAGLEILNQLKPFRTYVNDRDILAGETTHLSAHLKFGTVSVREAYHAIELTLGRTHPLLRQLYWRDFFTHIAWHFPHVFGGAFHKEYDKLTWNTDKKMLERWKKGTTGFPMIDAGMRELTQTGFMHNRARMITASFLVKDLHIDWREGEKVFAQYLVDYDPCVNNGNWQWAASTGCDAQPYFRIFNPWLQQEKFDPQCEYIKRWVPELQDLPPKAIHKWFKQQDGFTKYPAPMVDHSTEAATAKSMYKGL